MEPNPYESPAITLSPPKIPNLLLLPAIGCILLGIIAFLPSVRLITEGAWYLVVSYLTKSVRGEAEKGAWELVRVGAAGMGFTVSAFLVAWCLLRRRHKWLIVAGAVLGTLLIIPAPVTVLILMRMRNHGIWESFDKSSKSKGVGKLRT
jgi:hypothetical protein